MLPYRVSRALDRAAISIGWTEQTIEAQGLRFRVRRLSADHSVVRHVVSEREYFRHGIALTSSDTVVDIGGNIGTFTVLAASMGARVIVAEPDTTNFRLLMENVKANGFTQRVTAVNVAITDVIGGATLYITEQGGWHHTVPNMGGTPTQVPSITLPELFDRHAISHCRLLKVDCEGAEWGIINSTPVDYLRRVDQVAMEFHASRDEAARRDELANLCAHFERANLHMVGHDEVSGSPWWGHLWFSRHPSASE